MVNFQLLLKPSGFSRWSFSGWLVMASAGFYSPNFAAFLMHWLYLPIVIQWNVLMVFAWSFPPLMLLSGLVIPALCCFYFSKRLFSMDRVIVWKGYAHPTREPASPANAAMVHTTR